MTPHNVITLSEAERRGRVVLTRGDTLAMQATNWLWHEWLARDKLHLIAGQPGVGKTTLAIAFGAIVSTGGRWPDNSNAPRGDTLIWSSEDGHADTILPRWIANGGDPRRLHFVSGFSEAGGKRPRPFDPATDLPNLIEEARSIQELALVIVDPVVMAVAGDSHRSAEVRRGLAPLSELAETLGVAVLGVTHFSKGTAGRDTTERVTGSVAFAAAARVVLAAAKPLELDAQRRLVRAKSNLGPDGGGFEYGLERHEVQPGVWGQAVTWGRALEGNARDLVADIEGEDKPDSKVDEAVAWLVGELADGPVAQSVLQRRAAESGHSWRTIQRAKTRSNCQSCKDGSGWVWELAEAVT